MSFILGGAVNTIPTTGTAYNLTTAGTTNAAVIRNAPCSVFEITYSNPTATAMYAKFYNKASAPTVGTDVPVFTLSLPASSQADTLAFGEIGKRFSVGLAIAVTAGQLDADVAVASVGGKISATYL